MGFMDWGQTILFLLSNDFGLGTDSLIVSLSGNAVFWLWLRTDYFNTIKMSLRDGASMERWTFLTVIIADVIEKIFYFACYLSQLTRLVIEVKKCSVYSQI